MKYYPVSVETADPAVLKEEYETARQIGAVRVGGNVLFFRSGLKTYYIPYGCVAQCFRRVYQVPVKMCCGRGEIDYEHLILADHEKEIADILLPGTKAAQELIRLLKEKMPEADFRSPRERSGMTESTGAAAAGKPAEQG